MKWLSIRPLAYGLLVLALVAIFVVGALPKLQGQSLAEAGQTLVDALYANFIAELLSILITIFVIDRLNQRRLEEQRRQELVDQLSSRVPGFPAEAVRLLKDRGWYDEMDVFRALQNGGDFWKADLRGLRIPEDVSGLRMQSEEEIDLSGVKLEKANLRTTQLNEADLSGAQLNGADLRGAQLAMAYLWGTKLKSAYLNDALLTRASLRGAELMGASLYRAELTGAKDLTIGQLGTASTLEGCTLPDGTHLPVRGLSLDSESEWRQVFGAWTARGREEGWIYDYEEYGKVYEDYIDVRKIPQREDEGADT